MSARFSSVAQAPSRPLSPYDIGAYRLNVISPLYGLNHRFSVMQKSEEKLQHRVGQLAEQLAEIVGFKPKRKLVKGRFWKNIPIYASVISRYPYREKAELVGEVHRCHTGACVKE